MENLNIIAIEIIEGCNLNCSFCVRNASSNIIERIDIKFYEKFLNIISNLPYKPDIAITGGEPFLHPQLIYILKKTIEKGFKFSINTNGTIEDESIFSICKNTEFFKYFIISLDSYNEAIHNDIRGSSYAHKKTLSFIEALKKNTLSFCINMTVNEKNFNDIDKTIKLAKEIGAENISIATVKPSGRGESLLNLDQLRTIASQIIDNQYLICNEFKLYVAEATFFLYDMKNYKDAISKGEKWSCAFGNSTLHMKLNGDILGCTTCDLVIGNIFSQDKFDLNKFWKDNETLNKVREKKHLTGICSTCDYSDFCGGCRCRAYALTNSLFGDDPYCPIVMEHAN